jgi:DNA repair exonuclease SbcCD ATPase subunit
MKATLFLEDIGGFKGKREFVFESGTLNIIEAPNSGGKSSLVKALTGILSVPNDGKFDKNFSKEGKYLGILSDEHDTQKGFVNIHSDIGEIKLDFDTFQDELKIKQNGSYLEFPQHGDPKFLLSGILSNDTKILRQLRNSDEDNQPDDFKWAVTRLSKAYNYDEIVEHLKSEKELFATHKDDSQKLIKRMVGLTSEISKLEIELKKIDENLLKLEPKFKGQTEKLIKTRKDLIAKIETINKIIIERQSDLLENKEELDNFNNEIEKIDNKIIELEENLAELKLFGQKINDSDPNELKKIKEKKTVTINGEIEKLKESRGKIEGVYNLYYLAQENLINRETAICPLCDEGHLTKENLQMKIEKLKNEKDSINKTIMEKSQNIRQLEKELEDILSRKKELSLTIDDLKKKKGNQLKKKDEIQREFNSINTLINEKTKERERIENELNDLKNLISVDDEGINKLYSELEDQRTELSKSIDEKNYEIKSHNITIKGTKFNPNMALNISTKYLIKLENSITYAKKMADKQRQAAADRFNDAIKTLISELDFKEFKEIKLNKDFRLIVDRLDPRSNEYVSQLVSTLSTSEKLTIALILQIAIKETYLPLVPFLILDDVMEDFDEDRRNKIYRYLLNKAKEQNWIIISTKLKEEKVPIHVVSWNAA